MRRTPLVPGGLLLLALAICSTVPTVAQGQDDGFGPPPPPATTGPRIEIPEPSFDWGKVLHGDVVEHSFRILNTGDEVLRISQVKPG